MDLSKSWFAMAGDDGAQGGEGASATCIISRPNPINLYRGPSARGKMISLQVLISAPGPLRSGPSARCSVLRRRLK